MNQTRTLTVEPVGEREIVIIRSLDAPRDLVFRAHTEPDLLRRWMGPRTWELTECDIDLRAGGAWRYVMHGPDEAAMVMQGVYREVSPPARLVTTESFSDDWTGGETVNTTTFDEVDGVTTVTISVMYASREARDGALATGMEAGMAEGYGRLEELLAEIVTRSMSARSPIATAAAPTASRPSSPAPHPSGGTRSRRAPTGRPATSSGTSSTCTASSSGHSAAS